MRGIQVLGGQFLRRGGDFPFLSRPDEVNLYLQLHLRRVGVEAKPDQALGMSKDGSAGGSKDEKRGEEEPDDTSQGHKGFGAQEDEKQQESLGSAPPISNAQLSSSVHISSMLDKIPLSAHALCTLLIMQFYVGALCITLKHMVGVENLV